MAPLSGGAVHTPSRTGGDGDAVAVGAGNNGLVAAAFLPAGFITSRGPDQPERDRPDRTAKVYGYAG
jgi:hypothetical protein